MISLLTVEIRRLLARRMTRVLVLLTIASFAFAGTIAFLTSEADSAAVERAIAQGEAQCIRDLGGALDPIRDHTGEPVTREEFCAENPFVEDPRFHYRDFDEVLKGTGIPFLMLGWIVGASFIGAEWHHGTVATLLTWEPRRWRVLIAKVIAAGVMTFVGILVLQALLALALLPVGALRGTMDGVDADWFRDTSELALRVGAMATLAATLGFSIATIGRNTAGAFGVGFVYLAVIEGLIRGFKPSWNDWLLGDNVGLVMVGPEDVPGMGHSALTAALLLCAYAGALFMIAGFVFRTRDVT